MELSKEQNNIIKQIINMISLTHKRYISDDIFSKKIVGYAGTGKTTIIAELRNQIYKKFPNLNVAFLTPTGKASSVLKSKLKNSNAIYDQDFIGTIHSLIYKPETRYDSKLKTHVILRWIKKPLSAVYYNLVIIDEASMITEKIYNDLCYFEKSIIYIGDHGQLPPVGDNFNILKNPDFILTKIHRQALNSPIIALSKFVREEGYIPKNKFFSESVFKLPWDHKLTQKIWNEKIIFDNDLIILCAFNTTRANTNDKIRTKLKYEGILPTPGEKVICLHNNHSLNIMNGQIGTLIWVMPMGDDLYRMTIEFDDEIFESLIDIKCFGQVTYTIYENTLKSKKFKRQLSLAIKEGFSKVDYFDYGYCISVHKSQGSEWDKVIIFEQRTKKWDDEYYSRWLYTAVTRAKEKLFIISDYWG